MLAFGFGEDVRVPKSPRGEGGALGQGRGPQQAGRLWRRQPNARPRGRTAHPSRTPARLPGSGAPGAPMSCSRLAACHGPAATPGDWALPVFGFVCADLCSLPGLAGGPASALLPGAHSLFVVAFWVPFVCYLLVQKLGVLRIRSGLGGPAPSAAPLCCGALRALRGAHLVVQLGAACGSLCQGGARAPPGCAIRACLVRGVVFISSFPVFPTFSAAHSEAGRASTAWRAALSCNCLVWCIKFGVWFVQIRVCAVLTCLLNGVLPLQLCFYTHACKRHYADFWRPRTGGPEAAILELLVHSPSL